MYTGKRKWMTGKRFFRMEEDTDSFERAEYNDFVKWSNIFLTLSYPVNTFHEFISAINSFRNAFAFEKSSFLSVIDYPEKEKKGNMRQCPPSYFPKTRDPQPNVHSLMFYDIV